MSPTNQNPSLWKRWQEMFSALAIAMDYDPTEYLIERNRILERELALLKASVHSQEQKQETSQPNDESTEIKS